MKHSSGLVKVSVACVIVALATGCASPTTAPSVATTTGATTTAVISTTAVAATTTTEPVPTTVVETPWTFPPEAFQAAEQLAKEQRAEECRHRRDTGDKGQESFVDLISAPNAPRAVFVGDCDEPSYLYPEWGWVDERGSYEIEFDPSGLVYDSDGYAFSELPVGIAGIPWDAEHPAYRQYGAMTLREIAALPPGTPFCRRNELNAIYSEDLTFDRLVVGTYFDENTMAVPVSNVAIVVQEEPEDWGDAWVFGAAPRAEDGFWLWYWFGPGKC